MGTGKRQSILGKFPNITNGGKDEKKLKDLAKEFGLQARGMGGEHSAMDAQGTADISPSARFGVKESFVTSKLYNGLVELYKIEQKAGKSGVAGGSTGKGNDDNEPSCQLI
jgi:arginine kinase